MGKNRLMASPLTLAIAIKLALISQVSAQTSDADVERIQVKGSTPLSSSTTTDTLFGSKQVLNSDQIQNANTLSLPELLKTQFASVNLNDVQNNPFQPDLQYRGFTASPLLGLPQGISVYLNGSRVNEAFGDTVNWDLIPLDAIDSVALYSGSNPLFGQNTLGGALALKTKNGFSYEETEIEAGFGSDGRQEIGLETGGNSGNFGYYINLSDFEEDGWRDFSPSEVRQAFAAVSYHTDTTRIDFNYMYADNSLIGNGASPIELLEVESREAVYTNPDQTDLELNNFSINAEFELSESLLLNLNAFYRNTEVASINGDDSDFGPCQFDDGRITLCEFEEEEEEEEEEEDDEVADAEDNETVEFIGFDDQALSEITEFGLTDLDDIEELDGTFNTGNSDTDTYGIAGQITKKYSLADKPSEFIFGAGYQKGDINYEADTTFGILANDTAEDNRAVTPIMGLMSDEARVRLDVESETYYAFFLNSTELNDMLTLNIAGRFNSDDILMEDLSEDGDDSLDGDHKFSQFNPAISLDVKLNESHNVSIGFSQSSRTPSPAELSCADEDDPCRLPNGFVADPPLDQVVTQTFEVNYSGQIENLNFYANIFHSDSEDDIIFQQAGSVASRGFFINVDETRRQGLELGLDSSIGNLYYQLNYNYLDATYESSFTAFSPFRPEGDGEVTPGDTIPGQPENLFKAYFDYKFTDQISGGLELIAASGQYYRGDEANENEKIDGYRVVNLHASYAITEQFVVQLRVNNLLDEDYETFGTYGEADEVLEDIYPDVEAPNFVGPAAPRQFFVRARYQF